MCVWVFSPYFKACLPFKQKLSFIIIEIILTETLLSDIFTAVLITRLLGLPIYTDWCLFLEQASGSHVSLQQKQKCFVASFIAV